MSHPTITRLHLPGPALGACIFLAVERDTRGVVLSEAQRFNYYPATPFPMLSWTFEGDLRMVRDSSSSAAPVLEPALSRVVFSGPHRRPSASWSPGPVHALSVAFYPEALSRLLGIRLEPFMEQILPLDAMVSGPLWETLRSVQVVHGVAPFHGIEAALRPLWQTVGGNTTAPTVRDWLKSMAVRLAFSKTGVGVRQAQRLIKDWTGQSHRDLQLYARTEQAMACLAAQPAHAPVDLAGLAAEAGFADQSHLGREVRRVTGLSPRQLDALTRTEEAFWFYRLMKGHFKGERA